MVLEPSRRMLWVTSRDFGSYHHLLVFCTLPAAAQPQQHLRGDEALVLFSLANVLRPGSINLPTVALD